MFLSSWLRSLKQHSTSPRRRRGASRQFHENGSANITLVEKLEERTLLSAVYSSGEVDLAIPDQGQVTSTIVVPDSISIADINVTVNIDHSSDQDLDVFLIGPDGTPMRDRITASRIGSGKLTTTAPAVLAVRIIASVITVVLMKLQAVQQLEASQ